MKDLARSLRLFRAFRAEQQDPTAFYQLLADDTVNEISRFCQLGGSRVLDVGGASGYVADAIANAGGTTLTVEYDWDQILVHGRHLDRGVQGDGCRLPVTDAAFDVAYSSNVLEHVAQPEQMLEEMVRVVIPGGIVYVTFTNWYSPWGGHETSPWHYFGGEWAARRYERRYGHPAKNRFGEGLFPLHVGRVMRWASHQPEVEVLDAFPRYYPGWTWPLVHVPVLRELATWNLALVLRRQAVGLGEPLTDLQGAQPIGLLSPTGPLVESLAAAMARPVREEANLPGRPDVVVVANGGVVAGPGGSG